jgi:RHS repeat-associated protein
MADGNAELARRVAYHPYGAIRATNGVSDAYDYVSNERDGVSGLGDFRARPYRHDTGSFLASDSEIILSSTGASQPPPLASFAYANANPISFADSDGLSPVRKTEICRVTDLGPVNLENLGEEVTDHERYWGPIEHSFWRIASASTAQYQGGTLRLEYPSPEFRDYGLHMSRVFGSWRPRPKVPNPVGAIAGKIRGKLEGVIDRLDEIAPRAANALSYVDVAVTLRDSAKQNAYLLADDREERRFRALVSAASQTGSSSIFSGCATCRNPGQREDYLTSQFQRLHAARAARESNRHDRSWDTNDPNRR